MRTLTVIGAGHVGRALGRLFHTAGAFAIGNVLARSLPSARRGVDFIGAGCAVDRYAALGPADLYLLAVTDDQIVPACAALASATAVVASTVEEIREVSAAPESFR